MQTPLDRHMLPTDASLWGSLRPFSDHLALWKQKKKLCREGGVEPNRFSLVWWFFARKRKRTPKKKCSARRGRLSWVEKLPRRALAVGESPKVVAILWITPIDRAGSFEKYSIFSLFVQWWKVRFIFFNNKWMGLVVYISTKNEFELTKVGLIPSEKQHSISFTNSLWSESKIRISRKMGAVRITSLYPKFNGSHYCLPPSSIHKIGRFCKTNFGTIFGKILVQWLYSVLWVR